MLPYDQPCMYKLCSNMSFNYQNIIMGPQYTTLQMLIVVQYIGVIILVPKWPFSSTRNKKAHLVFFPRGLAATFNKDIARKVVSLSLANYYYVLLYCRMYV